MVEGLCGVVVVVVGGGGGGGGHHSNMPCISGTGLLPQSYVLTRCQGGA